MNWKSLLLLSLAFVVIAPGAVGAQTNSTPAEEEAGARAALKSELRSLRDVGDELVRVLIRPLDCKEDWRGQIASARIQALRASEMGAETVSVGAQVALVYPSLIPLVRDLDVAVKAIMLAENFGEAQSELANCREVNEMRAPFGPLLSTTRGEPVGVLSRTLLELIGERK